MKSGVARGRTSRLLPVFAGATAAFAVAGAALLIATAPGAAHAAPLLTHAAATPTMDPLMVPTSAATGSTLSNPTISTSSSGVELAVIMSCTTTVVGLIVAAVTLTALIRTGYGPFLRALLPRWLHPKATTPAEKPILRYKPANSPETGFDLYAEAPSPRGGRQGKRRAASRAASRDGWDDRDAPRQRRQRAGQSERGSSRAAPPRGSSSRGSSSRASRSRS